MRIPANSKFLAYVLSAKTLGIKDLLEANSYEFNIDTEFADKSQLAINRQPDIEQGDFVLCQVNGSNAFIGLCDTYKSGSDSTAYTLMLRQKEFLFDRFVFIKNEDTISTTGIEDFIAQTITDNWINSGDAMLDRTYMTVTADTHTRVYAKVATIVSLTDGTYNLKTFLGNCLEYYDIHVSFDFSTTGQLQLHVYHDSTADVSVNATLSDVTEYTEVYSVDALAKLNVQWDQTDGQDVIATFYRTYYLLSDRTITTDGTDPNRAAGTVRSAIIEAETEDEMYQKVIDTFAKNKYSHKINFMLSMDSKLYDYSEFYPGHDTQIKTKSGIRSTIVTGLTVSSSSRFAKLTFGKLKVTLIEKLRDIT